MQLNGCDKRFALHFYLNGTKNTAVHTAVTLESSLSVCSTHHSNTSVQLESLPEKTQYNLL